MAISRPLNSTAVSQADDVFYCVHDHMVVDGVRQPLDPALDSHADMRGDWIEYYEAILAHNRDGSRPFPTCAHQHHRHHDPACAFCSEDAVDPDEDQSDEDGNNDEEDGDSTNPVVPCEDAQLVVTVKNEDGFAVEEAQVDAGTAGSKRTDHNGIADFGHVASGEYDIIATKPAHAPKRRDPVGPDRALKTSVPTGKRTRVDLIQHPLCSDNVAYFTTANRFYYGFDWKTNIPVTFKEAHEGATPYDGYWDPAPEFGSIAMATTTTRDGAPWVSVETGGTTCVQINFDAFGGRVCMPCIENCRFHILPGAVAEVVTTKISNKTAEFEIRGMSDGEASCIVYCDNVEIGWFHIWCKSRATISLDLAYIKTNMTKSPHFPYNISLLKFELDRIFDQALLDFNIADLGVVDLSSDNWLRAQERYRFGLSNTDIEITDGFIDTLHNAASASLSLRTTGILPRADAYRLYFYIPPGICIGKNGHNIKGSVVNVGSSPAFILKAQSISAYNTAAHELGHALGLRHPSDTGSAIQLPAHLVDTVNFDVPRQAAKNGEPAVQNPTVGKKNVMAHDACNLMGYGGESQRGMLRYAQWKAASRR